MAHTLEWVAGSSSRRQKGRNAHYYLYELLVPRLRSPQKLKPGHLHPCEYQQTSYKPAAQVTVLQVLWEPNHKHNQVTTSTELATLQKLWVWILVFVGKKVLDSKQQQAPQMVHRSVVNQRCCHMRLMPGAGKWVG